MSAYDLETAIGLVLVWGSLVSLPFAILLACTRGKR